MFPRIFHRTKQCQCISSHVRSTFINQPIFCVFLSHMFPVLLCSCFYSLLLFSLLATINAYNSVVVSVITAMSQRLRLVRKTLYVNTFIFYVFTFLPHDATQSAVLLYGKSSVRPSVRTSYVCDVEVSHRLEFFENKVSRNFATSVNYKLVGPGIFFTMQLLRSNDH